MANVIDTEMIEVDQNGVENGDASDSDPEVEAMNASLGDSDDVRESKKPEHLRRKEQDRLIKKAKRPSATPPEGRTDGNNANVDEDGHGIGGVAVLPQRPLPYTKNSRKSRNGRGRGLPKKGGAGGKGTWGLPGSEMDTVGALDEHDPNYDSDSESAVKLLKVEPERTEEELTKLIDPVILEYFQHGIVDDVMASLFEMNLGKQMFKVVVLAITTAMEHKAHHREFASVLISDMYGHLLPEKDIERAFDELLESLDDLTLDIPEAPIMVGQFLARAVADDCIPPVFVNSHEGRVRGKHAKLALEKADVLLHMKHGLVRLDNVWGTGGGYKPVKALVKKIVLLLKEYLSSGDVTEATRCLRELDVPHFHHELVYEALNMVIDESTERAAIMMSKLLKSLSLAVIITADQFETGVRRIYDDILDICLDVPLGSVVLEKFITLGYNDGYISRKLYDDLPARGRKRFVSEGDGGRVKNTSALKALK